MFASLRLLSRRTLASQVSRIQSIAQAPVRQFSAEAAATKSGGWISGGGKWALLFGAAGLGGWYYAKENDFVGGVTGKAPSSAPTVPDYDKVRKAISDLMASDKAEEYDDGSFGPILVRLAWHCSGSYDKASNTGGSNGATMRFPPESGIGANKGLDVARKLLDPLKEQFPWISYSDLWTLAGAVAIEEMGGPEIPWRPGRTDQPDGKNCPPDGRLPDASKGAQHIRDIFYRMGFNDQEIVALSGAHALGRCHRDRSGFEGPWTNSPITFSNEYFKLLLDEKWNKKKWNGPLQYEDKTSKALMMLPTDMALVWDKKFKPYVELYAKDDEKFFQDFAKAFSTLLELGVPFKEELPNKA
ncbi:heme peroxidase [Coccomyxa subellipsoidea C-169]|uniref:Cytochrome c peroxidase, mitochondrial n=1 Tax=Coccomyxa subellipsoidea (strain C-169) TaxID=574566 RepID=I0YTN9_COCSC|nr:heme peroxidase [Coccomyxa subellipsoidea C-169]EIE21758.1 heme peroxidase [Coccomyxa subellipsoidea C-169]|eukprot:XP_005646302.1 heme peroxidase [Coccomyxa subellipsoidea C-169]